MSQQDPKRPHTKRSILPLALLLLVCCSSASAENYYRWQDNRGSTYFGDVAPENAVNPQRVELNLQQPLYVVERVIDGDTIVVQHAGKVRLLGINTPEIAHRDRAEEPLGKEAHQRLKQLLDGNKVYLEFDQQRRDKYQRLLAHVRLEDDTNINELLLREGLARALFLQPNMKHLKRYYQVESKAQEKKRGLWARPEFQIRPANKAEECIKRFCRLRGTVRRVERKRQYTYLQLAGKLQVAIHNQQLPQFLQAGIDSGEMEGKTIIVRGWVGLRKGKPYLQLQHTLQIQSLPP
jgi:endonuclease YncB( thermonuclease family)